MPDIPLSLRAVMLVEHLDLAAATHDDAARWEAYQLAFLSDDSMLSVTRKARQIGWSFMAAADAVSAGIITPNTTSIFVSINMEETKEKILYAKAIVEALDEKARPSIVDDNVVSVRFANGSRILSHPCKPVRGKGKARIYLDEFAHYAKDRIIYASALPATTRGGVIRMGSTPLGAVGMFHDVVTQRQQRYPGFRRYFVPWWYVGALCTDVTEAVSAAARLTTEQRVAKFGTERIKTIHANMMEDDFRQEYECDWVDESESFIPWEEIKVAQALGQEGKLYCAEIQQVAHAEGAIDRLRKELESKAIREKRIISLVAGMDIGRRRDKSELYIAEKVPSPTGIGDSLRVRLTVSMDKVPFEDQLQVGRWMMERLPVVRFCIDETGMGMMLAERLKNAYWTRVEPITFTNDSKEMMAVETKIRMQNGTLHLPPDRDLANQIHSIRRLVTPSKNIAFDVARNERHHADKFWGLALMCWAAHAPNSGGFR